MDATAGLQMSQPRPRPWLREQVLEGLELADAHQVEQLLARVREVLAHEVLTFTPRFLSSALRICVTSGVQPPQVVPALVLVLSAPTVVQPASMADADAAFRHVVAGADLCCCRQRSQRVGRGCTRTRRRCRKQHGLGVFRQWHRIRHRLVPHRVVRGIADQHGAEQLLALGIHDQLLVDLACAGRRTNTRARRPWCRARRRSIPLPRRAV